MTHKNLLYRLWLLTFLVFSINLPFLIKSRNNSISLNPKSSSGEITIISPENKTYTEPMSGYYPATVGFENDKDGDIPKDLVFFPGGVAGTTQVVSEVGGHKKVAELVDSSTVEQPSLRELINRTEGSFELWIYKHSGTSACYMNLRGNIAGTLEIRIDYQNNGKFEYLHSDGYSEFAQRLYQDQMWYHLRVDFNTATDSANIYLNGQLEVSGLIFASSADYIEEIIFRTTYAYTGTLYLDAVSYSWDPNYKIGDNMHQGLLLSFENGTSFEWIGYSLDKQSNKTIFGNMTIPLPSNKVNSIMKK